MPMSTTEQLIAGLELTLAGMVTVFLLLAFMVVLINGMSKLAHRIQPYALPNRAAGHGARDGDLDPKLVSAISAAVHRYRQNRR